MTIYDNEGRLIPWQLCQDAGDKTPELEWSWAGETVFVRLKTGEPVCEIQDGASPFEVVVRDTSRVPIKWATRLSNIIAHVRKLANEVRRAKEPVEEPEAPPPEPSLREFLGKFRRWYLERGGYVSHELTDWLDAHGVKGE